MWTVLFIPFIVQFIVIGIDECYFHLKRGLPRWERIGHPIDTFSVLLCVAFALFIPYSGLALKWYIGLAILSCLLVTKDEFVHKHHCPASEQWLHALLFLNHPILLTAIALIWRSLWGHDIFIAVDTRNKDALQTFLVIQTISASAFLIYQIIYWNFIWPKKEKSSTTPSTTP